jgi:hypothetical protein
MRRRTEPPLADHPHHWRIEEPHGPTSHGVCRHCGAERDFENGWVMDLRPAWKDEPAVTRRDIERGRVLG